MGEQRIRQGYRFQFQGFPIFIPLGIHICRSRYLDCDLNLNFAPSLVTIERLKDISISCSQLVKQTMQLCGFICSFLVMFAGKFRAIPPSHRAQVNVYGFWIWLWVWLVFEVFTPARELTSLALDSWVIRSSVILRIFLITSCASTAPCSSDRRRAARQEARFSALNGRESIGQHIYHPLKMYGQLILNLNSGLSKTNYKI